MPSSSSDFPYMPDIPMQPKARGKTVGPVEPSWRVILTRVMARSYEGESARQSKLEIPGILVAIQGGPSSTIFRLIVMLNACDEGLPFRTQTPAAGGATIAFEKNARTRLPVLKIPARPMHVRHDISRRDVVSLR